MENTKDITFINVNTECFQTYPCQHQVETDNGKCLIDVIDHTVTPMGSRLLKRWLALPLKQVDLIGCTNFEANVLKH